MIDDNTLGWSRTLEPWETISYQQDGHATHTHKPNGMDLEWFRRLFAKYGQYIRHCSPLRNLTAIDLRSARMQAVTLATSAQERGGEG